MFEISSIWDKEYSCTWLNEMKYLKEKGIRYSFVKTDENGMTVWKYTKSKSLFIALSEFYENVYMSGQ